MIKRLLYVILWLPGFFIIMCSYIIYPLIGWVIWKQSTEESWEDIDNFIMTIKEWVNT